MGTNGRLKACDGKIKYDTYDAALQHIQLFGRETSQLPYKCKFCDDFHVATIPGAQKRPSKKNLPFGRDKRKPPKMKMKNKPGRRRKTR